MNDLDEDEEDFDEEGFGFTKEDAEESEALLARAKSRVQEKMKRMKKDAPPPDLTLEKPLAKGSLEELLHIRSITDGIIETAEGDFVKIVEVNPILFSLLGEEEKNEIVAHYASWLNVAPVTVQIKTISRQADSSKYITELEKDLKDEIEDAVVRMGKSHLDYVKKTAQDIAKSRRWFVIFTYRGAEKDFFRIYNELESGAEMLRLILDNCGNSFPGDENPALSTMQTLYLMLNKQAYLYEDFQSRYIRIRNDLLAENRKKDAYAPIPQMAISRALAPHGLNASNPDYCIVDGLYQATFAIKGDSFPQYVYSGWTAWLYNLYQDVDIDIFLQKQDNIMGRVGSKVRNNKLKMRDTSDTSGGYYDLEGSVSAGYSILRGLANGQQFFWVSVLITINAKTRSEFYEKRKALHKTFKAKGLSLTNLKYMQKEAFLSVMPLNRLSPKIQSLARRNMLTYSVAAMYPFNQYEVSADTGIFIGLNRANGSLCVLDFYNRQQLPNGNILLLGPSGTGKTFAIQTMLMRMRMRGIGCIIIAPLKGFEYARAAKALGGEYIQITPESKNCINIMEIRETSAESMEILYGIESGSLLANKVLTLMTFLELLAGELSIEEEHLCEEAIIRTYMDFGFTYDNATLYVDKENGQKRPMPILGDLWERIKEYDSLFRIRALLERYVNGSAKMWNGQTNVNLENPYIVLDLSNLKGSLLPVGYFIATDYVNDRIKRDVTEKKVIAMDELWTMIGSGASRKTAQFVLEIIKTIRGFGGLSMIGTQGMNDFKALDNGAYGTEIVNNCATKIIVGINETTKESMVETFNLSRGEVRVVFEGKKRTGDALLILGGSKMEINISASDAEKKLITTNQKDLVSILNETKEKNVDTNTDTNNSTNTDTNIGVSA